MAEIILPPEENEETPQAPELNIDKPTENSKVITIEFEAKKTNKVSTKDTNQQLYTTDTDAWFEFKETTLENANGTYSVVFRNRHDGSIFQRTGDVVNGIAYYKIPEQEIRHAGAWRGQLVYTLENGNTTAREFGYDVKGHILDGKDVREIVVEDFETLMSQLNSMKDNAEQELANLVNTAERNETDRQAFFDGLVEDIDELQSIFEANEAQRKLAESERALNEDERIANEQGRETTESERVSNEEERISNESERIESELARKEEMEKARYSHFSNHTYNEIGERLDTIESNTFTSHIFDDSGAPGPKSLIRGNEEAGFYGFVQPSEFGLLTDNTDGQQDFNGANLALAVGLAQGTAQYSDTAWMKFSRNGEIVFVPVKPIRHTLSWNSIYNQGAVYGDNTVGFNPPNGRAGNKISVSAANNAFVIDEIEDHWRRDGAVIASIGDTIVARGFKEEANNGEFTVQSITDYQIVVDGELVDEERSKKVSVHNKKHEVKQDRKVTIGNHNFAVTLLKGGADDPLDSYNDADRGLVGAESEWNNLILPLHEQAKLGNWAYENYAGDVPDWGIGLTDLDLITHHTLGNGNYTWCQETGDAHPARRVGRGHGGASYGNVDVSWYVYWDRGWRPALRLLS